ncbi:hypothetical protein E2C01_071658 [Portunus trituberculatus]|uniref:Uncharacterized protein n=1 Tax=Portunus trituberculatus TaxID=210409 RepID=A0A5B7HVW8_PORTR|nr:hypothetical protein [Portunus trituberculatus]
MASPGMQHRVSLSSGRKAFHSSRFLAPPDPCPALPSSPPLHQVVPPYLERRAVNRDHVGGAAGDVWDLQEERSSLVEPGNHW